MTPLPVRPSVRAPAPRRAHSLVLALALLGTSGTLGALGGCERVGARAPAPSATGPIVIGAPWPWASRRDFLYDEGVLLALDEVNAAGGVLGRPLRLERVDDRESVDEGRLVAQRLVAARRVTAVVGHMQSFVSVPAAAVYDAAGIVYVSPTSTDAALTTPGYGHVFRVMFSDRAAGRQMAEVAATRGARQLAIYYVRNGYGRVLSNAFEVRASALGMNVVDRQSYEADDAGSAHRRELVRRWAERDVDAVFLAADAREAALFAREARRQRLDLLLLGGDAVGTPQLTEVGGDAVEGLLFPAPFHHDDPSPEARRFTDAFRRRYGRAPDVFAALGYDAVRVLAEAMRRARSTQSDSVARALHALHDWRGTTGVFAYDSLGDLPGKRIVQVVVRDGRLTWLPPGRAVAEAP